MELKRIGAFMARQISMKDVNCEVITARLSDQDKELYNDCVHLVINSTTPEINNQTKKTINNKIMNFNYS